MKKTLSIVSVAIACALSTVAFGHVKHVNTQTTPAVSSDDANPWYVGVYGGYGKVNEDVEYSTSTTNTGFLFGGDAGYQFMKNFGLELGFTHFADTKYNADLGSFTTTAQGTANYVIDLAATGRVFVAQNLSLFAKLGPALAHNNFTAGVPGTFTAEGEDYAVVGFGAAGVAYQFAQDWSASLQALGTTSSSNVPGMYGGALGVEYHF